MTNPNDPLLKSEEAVRKLLQRFAQTSDGFQRDDVAAAVVNLLINVARQAHTGRKNALDYYDEVAARGRAILADHYDAAGKRRNIFPFHQVVHMGFSNFKERQ